MSERDEGERPGEGKPSEVEPSEVEPSEVETAPPKVEADGKPLGRFQQILVEYGAIGIITFLSLSALTYTGFAVAFMVGFEVEGAGETAGALGAAAAGWALTKPIRIPLAIALTPIVAAVWHRVRGKQAQPKG